MAKGSSKSTKKAVTPAKKKLGKRKGISVILDIDELENLYKRQHGLGGDGDTKGIFRRVRRDGDGDTKG